MAVGKITGPGKATKKFGPLAGDLAAEEFAPQFDDIDTRAANRARNTNLFNASIIDALAPYIQKSAQASEATTQFSGGFGVGAPNLMAALQAAGRVQGANQQGFNNQIPFHIAGQGELDKLMSQKLASQERRDLSGQQATRRGQILQSLVEGLFKVQSQRFSQDLATKSFDLEEDKFGESKRAQKVAERIEKRRLRLDEQQQAFAEELALKEFGIALDDLSLRQQAQVLRETEVEFNITQTKKDNKTTGKGGKAKDARIAHGNALSENAISRFGSMWEQAHEEQKKTPKSHPDDFTDKKSGKLTDKLQGFNTDPNFIPDSPTKVDAQEAFERIWKRTARAALKLKLKPDRIRKILINAMKDSGWTVLPDSKTVQSFITSWVNSTKGGVAATSGSPGGGARP